MDAESFDDSLGGGFKCFFFTPKIVEDSHFDEHIFPMGWFNHQLEEKSPSGYQWGGDFTC